MLVHWIIKSIYFLLQIYIIILMIGGVLSYIRPDHRQPIVKFINAITVPPTNKLKKMFPALMVHGQQTSMDLSYFALMLICIIFSFLLEPLANLILGFIL